MGDVDVGGRMPAGWRMLPLVATGVMRAAGVAAAPAVVADGTGAQIVWTFMLEGAPEPPSPAPPVAPPGWRAAPVVPDRAMLRAGGGMVPGTRVDRATARLVWDAMAAEAPQRSGGSTEGA